MDDVTTTAEAPVERDAGRLLRLAVSCPACGSRPALRVTAAAVRALADREPGERVGTYQCQRRRCGAIFDLTVRAYRDAT